MEHIELLRGMCDAYYYECNSRELEPGGATTYVNVDNIIFNVNSSAELALDFYNKKNQKNFHLVKVYKLNFSGTCYSMIFCAQDDESDEHRLFRCVVNVVDDEVLLCEIKVDGKISNLVDHVDDYVQKVGERDEDLPFDTCKDGLGDCTAPGSDGAILVSPTMFCIMGEKSFSDLNEMCDDYIDPSLYDRCRIMTLEDVNCFDWVRKYAELAINFYNKKEQKNFILVKVERLYRIITSWNQYCMTFWARNGGTDEFRLFRSVFLLKVEDTPAEQDDDTPAEQDDDCVEKLNESNLASPSLL